MPEELAHELPLGAPSEAQLGIWLGHQRAADPSIYNAAECTWLEGDFDPDSFRAALALTLDEAESLRITLGERDGRPELCTLPPSEFRLESRDLRDETAPDSALRAAARCSLTTPFALDAALSRHHLFRLGDQRWAWLHVAHHLALDGFAFAQFGRRVAEQYTARLAGKPLPRMFSSIRAVLVEDRRYQESPERTLDRQFWHDELRGFTGVTLGTPHGAGPAHGIHQSRLLDPETSSALRRTASELKVTPWDVFVAAVGAESRVRTGVSSLALGLPVMLRFGSQAARTPCMAMNITAVPLPMAPETTFASLSREVHAALARQRKHQRYRYEHLKAERGPSSAPLFGPVVNVMPFELPQRFGPCRATLEVISPGPVEDVAFSLRTHGEGFEIGLDAHPAALQARELETFLDAFVERLRGWLEAPARAFGPATREIPAAEATPPSQLIAAHPSTTTRPALVAGPLSLDYAELDRAARRCAHELRALGAAERALVALDLPRGAPAVIAVLGALYAGSGYVALERSHPLARRQALLDKTHPRVLVTEPGRSDLARPEGCARFELDVPRLRDFSVNSAAASVADAAPVRPAPDAPAYVVFTSGSTGAPKGVVVTHGALAHFTAAARAAYDFRPDDRVLQFAPLGFDASVEELFVTWTAGATLVLRDDAMLDSLPAFLAACRELSISVLDLPTAFFHELALALEDPALSLPPALRLVILGGEAALPERVLAFRRRAPSVRLLNTYGPSEATVVATFADLTTWDGGAVPIGRALAGVGAEVVDDTGTRVLRGPAAGELYLTGPTLAAGYLGRDDLTRERFVTLPGIGRAYRTGDRVTRGADGELAFAGRVDDELKISGHRVVPAEVEATLTRVPGVRACAVLGQTTEGGLKRLIAHVEADSATLTPGELRRVLALELPAAMVPAVIELHERLPRTAHGKLDRKALGGSPVTTAPELPLDPFEREVVQAWHEVLGVPRVGLDDDFFRAGGTSLQVIQLANRLCRGGRTVTVAAIFRQPTPRGQAELLRSPSPTETVRDFTPREVALDRAAFSQRPKSSATAREHVLLTGATGFLGVQLLAHWLEHGAHVTCAIRATDVNAARRRLTEHAGHSQVDLASYPPRWDVCCLDLADPAWTAERLATALPATTLVFHAAAEVSLTRDYDSLFAPNVLATKTLLEFAARTGASFHHVSTLACLPQDHGAERFFPRHAGLHDGYQRTKWQAEALCEEAGELGLNVAVYRVGRLTGSRLQPATNAHDLVWRVARTATRSGAWPDLPVSEPWLPVDTAAERMVNLAGNGSARAPARAYHVLAGEPVALDRVRHALSLLGFELPAVPVPRFLELAERTADAEDRATLAFFQLAAAHTPPTPLPAIDDQHTRELLPDSAATGTDLAALLRYCRSAVAAAVLTPAAGIRAPR